MIYQKPEVVSLVEATVLIRGTKFGSTESQDMLKPQNIPDSDLDD